MGRKAGLGIFWIECIVLSLLEVERRSVGPAASGLIAFVACGGEILELS